MIVVIIAAVATWLLPAGKFNTLSYENNSFILITPVGTQQLPATQRTLDSLNILIPIEKFETGGIRKPVSVPGTYYTLPQNQQGIIAVLQAPIKVIYDTLKAIFLNK